LDRQQLADGEGGHSSWSACDKGRGAKSRGHAVRVLVELSIPPQGCSFSRSGGGEALEAGAAETPLFMKGLGVCSSYDNRFGR